MIDRRDHFRINLHPLYLPFYDALCAKLGVEWQPYSGLRTFDEQTELYAKGRTSGMIGKGFRVTNAKAGQSAHNYGCGTDWTKFDSQEKPIWLLKEDSSWQEYVTAVTAVGLRSGIEFGDIDHNELKLDVSWNEILAAFQHGGPAGSDEAMEHAMMNLKSLELPLASDSRSE